MEILYGVFHFKDDLIFFSRSVYIMKNIETDSGFYKEVIMKYIERAIGAKLLQAIRNYKSVLPVTRSQYIICVVHEII